MSNETISRVDTNLSDLFFNTDVSDAKEYDRGEFVGFNEAKLIGEAEMFLASLDRLGVGGLPSAGELIADFFGEDLMANSDRIGVLVRFSPDEIDAIEGWDGDGVEWPNPGLKRTRHARIKQLIALGLKVALKSPPAAKEKANGGRKKAAAQSG